MEIFLQSAVYIQLVTFITSLVFFNKYKHTPMKGLPFYYGLVAFVEILCMNFYKTGNVWLYNILLLIQINYFGYIFYQYIEGINKRITLGLIILFNLIYFGVYLMILFNLIYFGVYLFGINNYITESAPYSYVAGVILLIIILIMMFNHMLKIENYVGLTQNFLFWLCFSLIFFHATSLPLFSITRWSDVFGDFKTGALRLLFFSIIFSHLILIFGFIWSKKKYTY